ncbi:MAG: putative transporter, partial [Prevotellaceae bacterium]|nr:putative transporter [Prevotellaceae bacterium]
MGWLENLFFDSGLSGGVSVAHSVLILALAISSGILLGKIKVAGISLGVTWILFVGIAFSHFGMRLDKDVLHFVQEFGLILFVYSIGLQVGPGFFSSLKKGGMQLNLLAVSVVLLGLLVTCVIQQLTELPMSTMAGIMSGAVTNTPGLGAAQQACHDLTGAENPDIATGYAIAYPLAVVGIVATIIALRYLFKINLLKEEKSAFSSSGNSKDEPRRLSLRLGNPALNGKKVGEIHDLINRNYVISRIRHNDGTIEAARPDTILHLGDEMLVVTSVAAVPAITAFIGEEVSIEWMAFSPQLISRRILITKSELNGKSLEQLRVRSLGVNITRVNRSGVDLVAYPSLRLQIGDRLTVVGAEPAIAEVEKKLGNSLKRLNAPNLYPLFLGIFLGVILGSIPFTFSGIPQPVKLGLAGGPLLVSILISYFGPKFKLVTYTTMSANLMLREVGITMFLACVGLGAGERFIDTIVNGGYKWIGYGVLITLIPITVAGVVGRLLLKLNYFTLSGVIAGAMTDPPALAYANDAAGNDLPSVGYATVYPLTMFL